MKSPLALGIVGCVFGILAAILADLIGSLGSAFGQSNTLYINAIIAIVGSTVGIVGAAMDNKAGGILMIVGGIVVLISVSLFGFLTLIFYIIGGVLEIREKRPAITSVRSSTADWNLAELGSLRPGVINHETPSGSTMEPERGRPPSEIQITAQQVAPRSASPAQKARSGNRFCPYCGAFNPADYNFCEKCYRQLPTNSVGRQSPQVRSMPSSGSSESISSSPGERPLVQSMPSTGTTENVLSEPDKSDNLWLYLLVAAVTMLIVGVILFLALS
jgi:hypothetical protein